MACFLPGRAKDLSADKFLGRHISLCILFDGENISFDASLVKYIYIYIYIYVYIYSNNMVIISHCYYPTNALNYIKLRD